VSIAEGTHWLSAKFSKRFSQTPLVIASSNFFNNGKSILTTLLSYMNLITPGWNGLNFVNHNSTFLGVAELSFSNIHNQNKDLLNYSINWLYNYDHTVNEYGYNVYQGHHGDLNAQNSQVVLPSTSFIEKNSFYANLSGIVQKSKKVLFNVGNSRDD